MGLFYFQSGALREGRSQSLYVVFKEPLDSLEFVIRSIHVQSTDHTDYVNISGTSIISNILILVEILLHFDDVVPSFPDSFYHTS